MNKALWRIVSKKTTIFLIILFGIGLFLTVYGAMHSEEYSKGSSAYSESNVQILSIKNYSNRHIAESVGIVIIILGFILLKLHSSRKKIFFKNSDAAAQRFLDTDNEYSICINEEGVEYKSLDLYMKIKWLKFSNYKVYGNFIFIGLKENMPSIAIDKKLLIQDDLDSLFAILKANGIQQKIKSILN